MFERFKQKKIKADPSKYSLLEGPIKPKLRGIDMLLGGKSFFDRKTGENFHRLDDFGDVSRQKLFALLLKGVINVSDVIKVGNYHYSHKQNLDKVGSSQENIIAEMEADLFLIRNVFRNIDFIYYPEIRNTTTPVEHHNLIIDENNKKLNYFDFGSGFWLDEIEKHTESFPVLVKRFSEEIIEQNSKSTNFKDTIKILKKKLKILISQYSDNEFATFKKIVKKSGVDLDEKRKKTLFDNIKLRLQALYKVLSEIGV